MTINTELHSVNGILHFEGVEMEENAPKIHTFSKVTAFFIERFPKFAHFFIRTPIETLTDGNEHVFYVRKHEFEDWKTYAQAQLGTESTEPKLDINTILKNLKQQKIDLQQRQDRENHYANIM